MKYFISIICAFLLSISLHAETYLSSKINFQQYEFTKTIAEDDILIIESINIYVYEDGKLLTYFDGTLLDNVDESASLYSFKYDKLSRRLVFCSDSGMVTYNIDTEEVKFIKTGFPVYFFDVFNSVAMISNGEDFVWWDLDKGLIKREKIGITGEIMFRMVDTERFIIYHAQAAYLYSAGNYDKLFDGVEQLLHRYEAIQIYKNYLLYKPHNKKTVVFNMTTKQQEAELDNDLDSWNLLAFKDDKVYYSNNVSNLASYDLNTKESDIYSDIYVSDCFGRNGDIFYEANRKIYRFDEVNLQSEQIIRDITSTIPDKIEVLDNYIGILHRSPYLDIINMKGESILDRYIELPNHMAYTLGESNIIYYQNLDNQLLEFNMAENTAEVIHEFDYEVEQLYFQDGVLYYLYNGKLYKYKDNNQFEVFKDIINCYKLELIENSTIYYFSNVNDEEDHMYLSKIDLNSNEVVCDSMPVSKYASYRQIFIKKQDTIYLREFNKYRYINPQTLETINRIKWKDNIKF